uniref:Uncharacterized protein n=1 Tax=viral metagenome TaxID=1070528 RepID=A0A6C0LKI0_9ZZZZ
MSSTKTISWEGYFNEFLLTTSKHDIVNNIREYLSKENSVLVSGFNPREDYYWAKGTLANGVDYHIKIVLRKFKDNCHLWLEDIKSSKMSAREFCYTCAHFKSIFTNTNRDVLDSAFVNRLVSSKV